MFRRKNFFFLIMPFQKKNYLVLKQNLKPFFVSWVNVFSVFNIIILKWWKNDYSLVLMLWKFLTTVCDMSLEHEVSSVYKSSAILFYTLPHFPFFFLQTIKELEEWICFCYKHKLKFWTTVCNMSFEHEVGSVHKLHAMLFYTSPHFLFFS